VNLWWVYLHGVPCLVKKSRSREVERGATRLNEADHLKKSALSPTRNCASEGFKDNTHRRGPGEGVMRAR
jgi:hypothetical protein